MQIFRDSELITVPSKRYGSLLHLHSAIATLWIARMWLPDPRGSAGPQHLGTAGALLCPFQEFHVQHRLGLQLIRRGVVVPDRY